MFTKRYSIALPLLGAFLVTGCSQKTAQINPNDLPALLFSDAKTAIANLGEPEVDTPVQGKSGDNRFVSWNKFDERSLRVIYSGQSQNPISLSLVLLPLKTATDKAALLSKYHLKTTDPRYQLAFTPSATDPTKFTELTLEPTK